MDNTLQIECVNLRNCFRILYPLKYELPANTEYLLNPIKHLLFLDLLSYIFKSNNPTFTSCHDVIQTPPEWIWSTTNEVNFGQHETTSKRKDEMEETTIKIREFDYFTWLLKSKWKNVKKKWNVYHPKYSKQDKKSWIKI